jgi:hypothetical protein
MDKGMAVNILILTCAIAINLGASLDNKTDLVLPSGNCVVRCEAHVSLPLFAVAAYEKEKKISSITVLNYQEQERSQIDIPGNVFCMKFGQKNKTLYLGRNVEDAKGSACNIDAWEYKKNTQPEPISSGVNLQIVDGIWPLEDGHEMLLLTPPQPSLWNVNDRSIGIISGLPKTVYLSPLLDIGGGSVLVGMTAVSDPGFLLSIFMPVTLSHRYAIINHNECRGVIYDCQSAQFGARLRRDVPETVVVWDVGGDAKRSYLVSYSLTK